MRMRILLSLLCLLNFCGCVISDAYLTSHVTEAARADQKPVQKYDQEADHKASETAGEVGGVHWGYYFLYPISVPLDVATSPFQVLYFIFWNPRC